MKKVTSNDFKITFKDGTDFFSSGSASDSKVDLLKDFKFINVCILSAIRNCGQSMETVDNIAINFKIENGN